MLSFIKNQINRDILDTTNVLDIKPLPNSAFTRLNYYTKVNIYILGRSIEYDVKIQHPLHTTINFYQSTYLILDQPGMFNHHCGDCRIFGIDMANDL